jgi:hypothetical protein
VLTTLHTQYEREIKALLHIPETVETAALIPVRNYPEPLSSNCLLHKGIEPFSFFRGRHV